MKNSSNPIVLVLVLVALLVGGLIAWLTQTNNEPTPPTQTTKVELVTHEGNVDELVGTGSEVELAASTVLDYNKRRWGEERGGQLLASPARTEDARPLYHSKTVFVSTDRDGNPIVTRPSFSPIDPSTLNKLDHKEIPREDIGSYAGPQINVNDPSVQAYLAEARARSDKAKYLTKWANQQIEKGHVGPDGKPQLPEDVDGLVEKMKAADEKANGAKSDKKKNKAPGAAAGAAAGGSSAADAGAGASGGAKNGGGKKNKKKGG